MRGGDGINLRGFNADIGDIYRDGVREMVKFAVVLPILSVLKY